MPKDGITQWFKIALFEKNVVDENNFFTLKGQFSVVETEDEFYGLVSKSAHIIDVLYGPDLLEGKQQPITKIHNKTFENVSFSKTSLKNLVFNDCRFLGCLFIGTEFFDCEFHQCDFQNSNMYKSNFTNVYIDPIAFRRCLDKTKHQNIGVHLFQTLMKNGRLSDQPAFEATAKFYFLRWKRYQDLYEAKKSFPKLFWKSLRKFILYSRGAAWEWIFGSGIRLRYFLRTSAIVLFVNSTLNFSAREHFGLSEKGLITFLDSLYFTLVTMTTLGYGDISPSTQLGRAVIACEGVMGVLLFAVLASMIFRKIAS